LRADARVRVRITLQIYLECRSKSKKCDKQLTFIVRVSASFGQVTQKLKKTSGAIRKKKAVPNTASMANCLEYFTLDNDKDLLVSDNCGNHVIYFIIYVTLFLLIVSTFAF